MDRGLERALHDAISAIEETGLPYALVGGLAIGAWGVARATRDVDLYAPLSDPRTRSDLRHGLERRGFDVPALEEELQRFGVFRSRSRDGVFVDIFDAVGPLGQAVLDRRVPLEIEGHRLWIVNAEELLVLKVFSDRPKDLEDARRMVRVLRGRLDADRVVAWAKRLDESLGVDEVQARLREAGLVAGRGDDPEDAY